jgi:hypothetical protein
MKRAMVLMLVALPLLGSLGGCGNDEGDVGEEFRDETTGTIACAEICGRYSECVAEIDVSSCTDQCEDAADASEATELAADACEDCLSDRSCEDVAAAGCFDGCPVFATAD